VNNIPSGGLNVSNDVKQQHDINMRIFTAFVVTWWGGWIKDWGCCIDTLVRWVD
jgi:hypothetical protein